MPKKKPKTPPAPKEFRDSLLQGDREFLSRISRKAATGDFGGELSFLNPLTESDIGEISGLLEESFAPVFKRQEQDFINQAVAFGQGTTSALTSGLSDIASNQAATIAQGVLGERQRALQARQDIFGLGIGGLGTGVQAGLANQGQINQFRAQNFQNQLAASQLANQKTRGGLTGALTGGLGGFLAGGPIGSLAGGLAGGFGTPGTGGQLLTAGSLLGASTNPFGRQQGLRSAFPGAGNIPGSGLFGTRLGGFTQSEALGLDTRQFRSF